MEEEPSTETEIKKLLLLSKVEKFLIRELALLDDRRFEEWVDLFDDEGFYWAPATLDQINPTDSISLFYDNVEMRALLLHMMKKVPPDPTRPTTLCASV